MAQETIYYFSGASYQKEKLEYNVDQLFSQYHERALVRKTIEYKKEHPEHTGKIMVDSGAFTAYTKGVTIDIDDYLRFIEEVGDWVEIFAEVDDVPDPNNMDYSKADTSWNNYLYMIEHVDPKYKHKIIPVFHYGEDFQHLRRMLEFVHDDGRHIDYIGLAISLEGTQKVRISWANECRRIIKESSNPDVKTHAFGVGVKNVLDHIDVTSTDATSWVKCAAYGMIRIDDNSVYVSDELVNRFDGRHYTQRSKSYREEVERIVKERGYDMHELATSSKARVRFNIEDTLNWVKKLNQDKSYLTRVDLGW